MPVSRGRPRSPAVDQAVSQAVSELLADRGYAAMSIEQAASAAKVSTLEHTIPVYHFHEQHSRWIDASPTQVWQALTTLTLDQLTLTRPLIALRHLGTHAPSANQPLFTDGPLAMLEITAPTYAVGGAIARPWRRHPERRDIATLSEFARFDEPGWTKYLADFHLEPRDGGVQLTTETRGYSTNDWARRRFTLYCALIRMGSGLVRRDMLATVSRLATRTPQPTPTTG